jgi:sigma-B regulation protein RsbU (phosphoserine phosphatase)
VRAPAEIKILIVEDDPFFQRVLQKRIAADGYQVQIASDGREGMKAIVTFEPDLVISDWMMPQVDGLELCQSVKTGLKDAAPYFILLTAKGEIDNKLLGLETGADDYLVKPCDHGELMARVRAGLRIVLLTQALRAANAEQAAKTRRMAAELLPTCSSCGKVQDASGNWRELDDYLVDRRRTELTPGLCGDCRTLPENERKSA